MRSRFPRTAAALLVVVSLFPVTASVAAEPARGRVGGPWRGRPGITETVAQIMARDRRAAEPPKGPPEQRIPPGRLDEPKAENPEAPRVAATGGQKVPSQIGPKVAPTVGTSFLAAQLSESGFIPPDTMGSVGPTQILVHVNGRVKVFDKAGNVGALNASDTTFWSSVSGGHDLTDPEVEYDRLSERWFLSIINIPPSGANRVLVAVSSGSTVTAPSSFTFFQFQHDQVGPTPNVDTGDFADYPQMGLDKFALYIGVNLFTSSSGSFAGTTGFVVDKADLISGMLTVTAFRGLINTAPSPDTGPFAPQGVTNEDPLATEGYFIGVDVGVFSRLVILRVTDPGGTPMISGNINLTVPTTTFPMFGVPQPNPGPDLDDIDDRLFAAMIARNPAGQLRLWTAHNIEVNSSGVAASNGNRDGSRWYEIGNLTGSPSLIQSGTLFDNASSHQFSYWIPSIAANGQGHAVLGASRASDSSSNGGHASVAVAERLATDSLGTIGAPVLAQSSSFIYNTSFPGTERWGDYSQTVIDPTDNMTFWTFQEYANATNSWGVRVIEVMAPPPATPSSASPPTIPPGDASETVVITGTSTDGSGFFDPGPDTGGPGFANHITATVSGGVTVNSITYDSPMQVTLDVSTVGAPTGSKTVTITNPDGQSAGGDILTVAMPDATPPTSFDLVSPADGAATATASPMLSWQASSDPESGLAKYQLWVDGTLNRDNISSLSTSTTPSTPLSDGPHTWFVKAFNTQGGSTNSTSTRTINVDTTPPAAFGLVSPADGAIATTASPTFSWEASSDAGSGLAKYQLWIDGSLDKDDISPGTSSTTPTAPLSEGLHTWFVRAIDNAGRDTDSTSTRDITVETTPPAPFGLLAPADGATVPTASPTFSWEASSDSGSGLAKYQLWIDGSLNKDDISPATTSTTPMGPLSEGPHTWRLRAMDGVGNVTDSATRSLTVDVPGVHERDVSLALRKHLRARGTLSVLDGFLACLTDSQIDIQRMTKAGWKTAKMVQPSAEGKYRTRLRDRPGKYRAMVAESSVGSDECTQAVSATRRHRH